MAFFFSNIISFLFFTTLSLSLQIHARDSQFFSKVTHANNNNNVQEMEVIPNKQEAVNKKPSEQEPMFIPETDHNSYGLYGHETGQFPPRMTESEDAYNTNQNDFNNDDTSKYRKVYYNSVSNQKENSQNKYYYSNNNAASGEREGMSDTRFMEAGKYFYNPTFYGDHSTRGQESKTWVNNMGYFGRPYENSNAMEPYQNQQFEP